MSPNIKNKSYEIAILKKSALEIIKVTFQKNYETENHFLQNDQRPVEQENQMYQSTQCQLNKEPGQETQAKKLNFGHMIKTHGLSTVF